MLTPFQHWLLQTLRDGGICARRTPTSAFVVITPDGITCPLMYRIGITYLHERGLIVETQLSVILTQAGLAIANITPPFPAGEMPPSPPFPPRHLADIFKKTGEP